MLFKSRAAHIKTHLAADLVCHLKNCITDTLWTMQAHREDSADETSSSSDNDDDDVSSLHMQ